MSKYYSSSIAFGANQTKTERVVVSPTKIGDVTTDAVSGALTVDEVPTLDSLNPVSSDGVARAVIQAGAELPTRGSSDTGKVLTVANADGDLEWDEPAGGLPDMEGQSGKLLGAVDNNGTMEAQWVNPPDSYPSVAGNAGKVLKVNAGATGVEWANESTVTVDQTYNSSSANAQSGTAVAQAIASIPSSSYTAGDGIDIANNAVSAKLATGLKIESGSLPINESIGRTTSSWSGEFFTLNSDMCAAIEGSGLTFTKKSDISIYGSVYWAIIPKSSADSYGVSNYLIFGSWVNVSTNPTITLLSSNINSGSSTITWATVKANPSNYCVVCLEEWSEGLRPHIFTLSSSDLSTGTIAYTKTFVNAIGVINPLPASTDADINKFLKVNAQGSAEWDTIVAGNGLKQTSNEFSVKAGNGISFADAQEQKTLTLQGIPNGSGWGEYFTGKISIIGLLNEDLVNAIEDGPITINLTFNEWSSNVKYRLSIVEWDASSSLPNVMTSIRSNTDTAASAGTYTFDLSSTTASGGLQFSSVKANPQGYALAFVNPQYNESELGTNNYSGPVNTGSTAVTIVTHNAVTVTNPIPASTSADENKVLTVNASGNAEWAMPALGSVQNIQQVNALPANPDANTLYLIPET